MGLTSEKDKAQQHVAIVTIDGTIEAKGKNNAEVVNKLLKEAFENNNSKGVIVKLSSPGGSPDHSLMIYEEILRLKEKTKKPVHSVVTDLCASGCYFIASATDNIYSQKTSLIGSIGVISSVWDVSKFLEEHKIKNRIITSGDNKAFLSPFNPPSKEQEKFWKEQLKITHDIFIESVKKGRGNRLNQDKNIFSGLVYAAPNALNLGLIDGYETVDSLLRNKFDNAKPVNYSLNALEQRNMLMGTQSFVKDIVLQIIQEQNYQLN